MVTKKRWKEVLEYAGKWASRLRLGEWRIKLNHDEIDQDISGGCAAVMGSMTADIVLQRSVVQGDDVELLRSTVIHELLHVVLCPLRELANKRFVSEEELYNAEERAVLQLEKALMEFDHAV